MTAIFPADFPSARRSGSVALQRATSVEVEVANLMANLDGMLFRCQIDSDWTLRYVSEGCEALTGYRPDELLDNRISSFEALMHPDDRGPVRAAIVAALAERRRYEVEYRILRRDGSECWVSERGTGACECNGGFEALEGIVQDISARKQSERQLAEAERRYRSIFENAVEGMFQSSPAGRFLTVNPALARIYGYDSPAQLIAELADIEHGLYLRPERRQQFVELMSAAGSVSGFESEVRRRDGSVIWISETARTVCDDAGTLLFYEGTVEAITERKRYEDQIRYQATHDSLTGLPNRSLLQDSLQAAMTAAHWSGLDVAIAFIDLDQFKLVNDSLGHAAGDELLVLVARRLRASLRRCDLVARQGGDEFVVLFGHDDDSPADVLQLADSLLASLALPCVIAGREISLSCSIGVAIWPKHAGDADTLLRCADIAMYRAKDMGRNNVQVFDAGMHRHTSERLDLLADLRRAVDRGELVLHYEPQYALDSGRIVGVEALVRWQRADGLVMPGRFIPLAEETGLIQAIGRWVLRAACLQNRVWQAAGLPALPVAVNLSRLQLVHGDIVGEVERVLAETGLDARYLQLEITESMVMRDPGKALPRLQELCSLGVAMALDDFGSGYSNLSEIRRLPISSLKIDRSFVSETHTGSGAAIARAIISLGHIMGLEVLGEGVETPEQLRFLRDNGCDLAQGYLLARAMPADAFARLLGEPGSIPALQPDSAR